MKAIAVDGPAGSGKSTVAKALAKQLNYLYIDTGAMYRALTLKMIRHHLLDTKEDHLMEQLKDTSIQLAGDPESQRVILDGEDVTEEIRKNLVSNQVSGVASIPSIRVMMMQQQRELARHHDVVMDGRDIGTVILPNADHKFYIDASLKERAKRRKKDFAALDEDITLEKIIESIAARDHQDKNRRMSPLQKADDAIEIDTTNLAIKDVLIQIQQVITENEKKEFTL